jgi:hypothetical protein
MSRDCTNGVGRLVHVEPPYVVEFWLLLRTLATRGANIDNNITNSVEMSCRWNFFFLVCLDWSRMVAATYELQRSVQCLKMCYGIRIPNVSCSFLLLTLAASLAGKHLAHLEDVILALPYRVY